MQATIDITWLDLALFMLLLSIPVAISHWLQLGIGRDIGIAVLRMTLQLLLVGIYLQFLFDLNSVWLNLTWLATMILIGASAILSGAKLPKRLLFLPILTSITLSLLPVLAILLLGLLQPTPTYSAQYLIPLAGMLLGNSLSGNIVALQRLFSALAENRSEYEGRLALGARPKQASMPFVQSALKQSLAPILASMATTGLVTLPGMMTGQILGGSDPMLAVKYQLIILLAIFVVLSVCVTTSLLLSVRVALNPSGKLLINKIN